MYLYTYQYFQRILLRRRSSIFEEALTLASHIQQPHFASPAWRTPRTAIPGRACARRVRCKSIYSLLQFKSSKWIFLPKLKIIFLSNCQKTASLGINRPNYGHNSAVLPYNQNQFVFKKRNLAKSTFSNNSHLLMKRRHCQVFQTF